MWETWDIKGHTLEYNDEHHQYICDGLEVPSVTQLLHRRFPKKYAGIPGAVLDKAARRGTMLHSAIETEERLLRGEDIDIVMYNEMLEEMDEEMRNYRFLKKAYQFSVLQNEVPVLVPFNGNIVAAGRLDIFGSYRDRGMLADIKRTSVLDKDYLSYQLTLYKLGWEYCYDSQIDYLFCIWLREDKRQFKAIPECRNLALELLEEIQEGI